MRRDLARRVRDERKDPGAHSKQRFNATYQLQLFDLYGAYPTAIGHTKEYVPFFQGHGAAPVKPEPITLFDAELRTDEMAKAWQKTSGYASPPSCAKSRRTSPTIQRGCPLSLGMYRRPMKYLSSSCVK